MEFSVQGPAYGVATQCEPILEALPDWFGIPSAVEEYARTLNTLPTFMAMHDQQTAGFLTLKPQNPYAAELYVLGVRCEFHRQGLGRAMLQQAESWLAASGVEYAFVKTLGASCTCEPWGRTRLFYAAMGYRPLQEFHAMWAGNPCLMMVKHLGC